MAKDRYNGMKRAGDWVGKEIVTVREMGNGLGVFPPGTKGVVESVSCGALNLRLIGCERCNIQARITRVDYFAGKLAS